MTWPAILRIMRPNKLANLFAGREDAQTSGRVSANAPYKCSRVLTL